VNAFEDAKCSESIVSDTLRSLTEQARLLREKIDLLEAGQHLVRAEVTADLDKLLSTCQNLRDAVLSEDSAATWTTKDELCALVGRLDDTAAKRRRYLDLAQLLSAGTVSHRRERTRLERLAQRDAAVAELMEISAQAAPPELPGPAIKQWLNWACNLEDGTNDAELQNLKASFPRVDDFVRQMEIELWHDGPESNSPGGSSASPKPNSGAKKSKIPSAPPIAEASPVHSEPIHGGSTPVHSSLSVEESPSVQSSQTSVMVAEPEPVAEPQPVDVPDPSLNPLEVGKPSFFSLDDVAEFRRFIEQAKVTSIRGRKVRALLAISQWLTPSDQNPVLHPAFGIRAQVGYAGTSDLTPVTPEEAESAIEADEDLLLLTGGADLLRWGIAQSDKEQPFAVASVPRLNKDQLRSWFVDLHKIALSEPQVQDIYRLTYGVPLLVGELHRLIIPVPEAPPTWLGYGIWTEMKARFERRLPTLGQELRNGSATVRLTHRELGLLKMVLIASDYSSNDAIVTNLTDNWYQYHPPELPAMTSSDEESVALLQILGLLPFRKDPGLTAIQSILPFDPEDPVRQIASHL